MSRSRIAVLANALGYQCVWFACVASAAAHRPVWGLLASLSFTLATVGFGGCWRNDLRTLGIVLPLGIGMDSLFATADWLAYPGQAAAAVLPPGWLAAIWMGFAMTLNHSLAFLRGRAWLAATLGMLAAPAAYWAASRGFGVLEFMRPAPTVLVALGLAWALFLPAILALDARPVRREAVA